MDPVLVGRFWLIAALLALTPGADWAYAIAAGLRARSIGPSVVGMLAGYALVITALAVGVGALVVRYPVVLTTITYAGAAYLLWLGVSTLLSRAGHVGPADRSIGEGAVSRFLRGAGVSGLNPKGLLLLAALLPQFTTPTGPPLPVQMLVLGGLHLLDCAVVYSAVAALARRVLRARPRVVTVVTKTAGVAMLLIGASLLVERITGAA
jgi:threonine/homoserine/homoserine lactone efflux protein